MSEYSNDRPLHALERTVQALSNLGGEAFLYGSSVVAFQEGHDIDVLFVLAETLHQHVYQQVAIAQAECPLLLHPTLVTPEQFATNPRIRELTNGAIRLW